MRHRRLVLLVIISLMFSLLTGCGNDTGQAERDTVVKEENGQNEAENAAEEPEPVQNEITLAFVGDILIHDRVYDDAEVVDGYDFKPMLARMKPYLEAADITVANQETMIGGEEIGLSGYPSFNSPYEVGDALKDAGIDVVTLANNHTLDRGEQAIQNAIFYWEELEMMYTGAYKDEQDSEEIRVYETDENISIAFLAYTYGTNGIPVPEGKDYLVNLIDEEKIKEDLYLAKEQADVVVLSLHFGPEYERYPSDEQKELVQLAADEGADIVFGHHSHVLQPIEWVEGKDGNKTLAAYSLGNFLSGQDELYRQIGGILSLKIVKTEGEEEEITIETPEFLPTYVTFEPDESDYEVWPMKNITEGQLPEAEMHYEEIKQHIQQWMPELVITGDEAEQ